MPRLGDKLADRQLAILDAASTLTTASAHRVRISLATLIGVLGTRGALHSEAGRPLLLFLLRQAALPVDEASLKPRRAVEATGPAETRDVSAKVRMHQSVVLSN